MCKRVKCKGVHIHTHTHRRVQYVHADKHTHKQIMAEPSYYLSKQS